MPDLKETVILHKLGNFAVIGFALEPDTGVVFTSNMKTGANVIKEFPTAKETWAKFNEALQLSVERGWKVAHRGKPNYG